jgi:hypothetical protein
MKNTNLYAKPLVVSAAGQRREDLERTLALAGASEHPIFKAVLGYADEHARNEHETALAPNLSNEVRQFNAGRSAAAYDFAIALRQLQAAAESRATRLKAED